VSLRATKNGECIYGRTYAELRHLAEEGWDIEEYVVGLGWIM